MFISYISVILDRIVFKVSGGVGDLFYKLVLFFILFCFSLLRCPYIFGVGGFGGFLLVSILPLFLCLFLSRCSFGVLSFLASFIPLGTPLWIAPFVCLAETISYIVRPLVLMVRPFLNISIGALGGAALGGMCISLSNYIIIFLGVLFLYEIFVALVHWYIVCNILSFSIDH